MNRITPLTLLALVAVLALSGCGGGDSSSGGAYGGSGAETTSAKAAAGEGASASSPAELGIAGAAGVGPVLVDADGFTVYDFHKDEGTTSACYGACARAWPPVLTTGPPSASGSAMPSQLGTTKRRDGSVQVTYAGHPLYTYAADQKPGEANGNDVDAFGAEWYALQASGKEAEG